MSATVCEFCRRPQGKDVGECWPSGDVNCLRATAARADAAEAKIADMQQRNALDDAADEIAALCGCAHWDYPGQLVQDVKRLLSERDTLRAELAQAKARADGLAADVKRLGWDVVNSRAELAAAQKRIEAGVAECDEYDHGENRLGERVVARAIRAALTGGDRD